MSYSFEATGFFVEQRAADGQYVEGDLLPMVLTEDKAATLENQNAGASEVVEEALGLARIMIVNDRFGDFQETRYKILINGHVQNPDDPNSSKSYCQIRIEAL